MAGDPVPAAPSPTALAGILREHVQQLHSLYGEGRGLRIARKHVGWYFDAAAVGGHWRQRFNALEDAPAQLALLEQLFDELENGRLAA